MTRDNGSREEALAIVATQASKNEHTTLADGVLFNTGSLTELKYHVEELHAKYLSRAYTSKTIETTQPK